MKEGGKSGVLSEKVRMQNEGLKLKGRDREMEDLSVVSLGNSEKQAF